VVVAWQGGEPTMMGLDLFRRSVELERKYAAPGQRALNTIQTNGSLLDDERGRFPPTRHYQVTSTGLRHAIFLPTSTTASCKPGLPNSPDRTKHPSAKPLQCTRPPSTTSLSEQE
jgi:hypothetical protein